MNRLSRPSALKIAAVLSFLMQAFNVATALPFIMMGSEAANEATPGPPYAIIMLSFVLAIIGIIAAYGTWKQMRWGIILTIAVNVLGGLSAAPGIVFRPTPALFVGALVTVLLSIVVVILCLWRDRKTALA